MMHIRNRGHTEVRWCLDTDTRCAPARARSNNVTKKSKNDESRIPVF